MNKYRIGAYDLEIPDDFALADYQKSFRLYDRFLPELVRFLDPKGSIVDVGANIGDTAYAILQNCQNSIICFEPSDVFYPYLERNIAALPKELGCRVSNYKEFIGTGAISGNLEHTVGGTAGLKVHLDKTLSTHKSLDFLLKEVHQVDLVKIDTDGFDYDVINSGLETIRKQKPMLFWENFLFEENEIDFQKAYDSLFQIGYNSIFIFDNFGNIISEESDFHTLKMINRYVNSMEKHNCTRTIFYTDVLAVTQKHEKLAKKAIQEFKANWIYRS